MNKKMNDLPKQSLTCICQIIRGVALGVLLFAAVVFLLLSSADTLLFRYQGF